MRDYAAGFHDQEFVAVAGGEVAVVDCDDGLAFRFGDDVADDGEQAYLMVEVEGGGGFVEKEELGFAYQHLGDAGELALAAGHVADHPVGDVEDAEAVHHRGGGLEWVGDGAASFCGDHDGFERGQRRAGQQVLGDVADVVGSAGGGDGPGRGGFEAGDSFACPEVL